MLKLVYCEIVVWMYRPVTVGCMHFDSMMVKSSATAGNT